MDRYESGTVSGPIVLAGPGTRLGVDELPEGRSALVLGDPAATAFVVEGTRVQLRGYVRRLQELLDTAWGYQHPLMGAAIEALARVGVNAEATAGPRAGMITVAVALTDGTVLELYPGDEHWWPLSPQMTWRFTGWQALHYDPSEGGIHDPIGALDLGAVTACEMAQHIAAYLYGTWPPCAP